MIRENHKFFALSDCTSQRRLSNLRRNVAQIRNCPEIEEPRRRASGCKLESARELQNCTEIANNTRILEEGGAVEERLEVERSRIFSDLDK